MKAAAFDYVRPTTVADACRELAADEDARLIAGGQTLVPMMAMRLARPTLLIDISRIDALRGIALEGDNVKIGAATRQCVAERDPLIKSQLPLLAKALPFVGHTPTRNRGTVGGSVANADPAAEIPLVFVTLDGFATVQTVAGIETIPAADFFLGPMMTAVVATGCLIDMHLPIWRAGRIGTGFLEISGRAGDFAYVAAAAQVALDADGRCTACAIGIGGAPPAPTRLAIQSLVGTRLTNDDLKNVLIAEIETLDIMVDAHASQAYRRRVATTLAIRAVTAARDEALAPGADGE